MRRTAPRCIVILLVLAGGSATTYAQRQAAISGLTQLDCTFPVSAAVSWGQPQPRVETRQAGLLELRIGAIDQARGTSEFMYGAVSIPATVLAGGSMLHFVEPPATGAMALASVRVTSRDAKRFEAVYTRTEYYAYDGPGFTSSPRAEQYYGYCVPTFK